jgi:serine/threonine-protein kinase HipA
MSSSDELVVILDAPELGPVRPVGVLTRWPGRVLSVGFAYAASWLRAGGDAFAIDPSLPLVEYPTTVPGRRLPGIFADTSPDLWGAALLRRREGRDLDAWGLMVGVDDGTRMGALRLRAGVDGPFVSDRDPVIPPATSLRALQTAVRRFEDDPDARAMDPAIAQLIAPGSSLGGARPKANYREPDGSLWIAKFPSKTDRRDVGAWEHAYAQLARRAGIEVSDTGVLDIGGQGHAFVTRRFDRTRESRRLYASALTLSGRETTADADYADIAQAITRWVAPVYVRADLAQLYRRMAFNVLAGNRDDHLRNHGLLRTAAGWRLAPAFDMNPSREMREHATAINGRVSGVTASDVLAARSHFGLTSEGARGLIAEVADAVAGWRDVARDTGIPRAKIEDVASAFAPLASVGDLPRG